MTKRNFTKAVGKGVEIYVIDCKCVLFVGNNFFGPLLYFEDLLRKMIEKRGKTVPFF